MSPSTIGQLSVVVDAPVQTIYVHLRRFKLAGLVTATKVLGSSNGGPKPFLYSIADLSIPTPPPTNRSIASNELEHQIWDALEKQPATIKELTRSIFASRVTIYRILTNWLKLGLVAATRSPDGPRKPSLRYSITNDQIK